MAEICVDCWNRISGREDTKRKFVVSKDADLCEECGKYKPVIVRMRRWYIFCSSLGEWISDMQMLYGKRR